MTFQDQEARPIVAIVGRPNVGKSRLFNRLLRRMRSIVDDMPGVTRDRIYAETVLEGDTETREVILVDTGGFDPRSEDPITRRILDQTQLAIDEADVIVFLTDGRAGLVPEDQSIARLLRKGEKTVLVAVNKVDGPAQEVGMHEFHGLGFEHLIAVSAEHGRHVGELEELVVSVLPRRPDSNLGRVLRPALRTTRSEDEDEDEGRYAAVGAYEGSSEADDDTDHVADHGVGDDTDEDIVHVADRGVDDNAGEDTAHVSDHDADHADADDADADDTDADDTDADDTDADDTDVDDADADREVRTGDRHDERPGEASDDLNVPIKVAVIGRPNSGKSSLINRLLGEDRHLVSEVAGTTVDTVDSLVQHRDRSYLFIDTAGIRRKRSIALRLERFSVVAALKGLERSDVALLVLDATQPIATQDAKVSAFAYEKGKAVVLVVSKWDLAQKGQTERSHATALREELKHLSYAPVVFTSAHTGFGADRLFPAISRVHKEYGQRVTTGRLNRLVEELMENHPPPTKKGRRGRIYYISQIDVRPPRFLVSVNDPDLFHFSYRRFLVNELRRAYGFAGSPVLVGYRSHKKKGDEAGASEARPREKGAKEVERSPAKKATAARRARKKTGRAQNTASRATPRQGDKATERSSAGRKRPKS